MDNEGTMQSGVETSHDSNDRHQSKHRHGGASSQHHHGKKKHHHHHSASGNKHHRHRSKSHQRKEKKSNQHSNADPMSLPRDANFPQRSPKVPNQPEYIPDQPEASETQGNGKESHYRHSERNKEHGYYPERSSNNSNQPKFIPHNREAARNPQNRKEGHYRKRTPMEPVDSPEFIQDTGDSQPYVARWAPDNNTQDKFSGANVYSHQFKSDPETLHKNEFGGTQIGGSKPAGAPYPLTGLNALEPESNRTPGAYREGGSLSGYDSDNYTMSYEENVARAPNDIEDPELPVAFPAEIVKDTAECMHVWWSKPRNRLMLIVGVTLIIGGFVGLVVALLLKSIDDGATEVDAVPSCVGAVALAWGEPHLTTFDNLKYDCQGQGEFVLVRSLEGRFEVQARFSALDHDDRTSKITAVAISQGLDTPVVQLSLPENPSETTEKVDVCLLDLWVDGTQRSIHEGSGQDKAVEVTVSGKRVNLLYKSSGAAVTVDVMSSSTFECFLNTFVCLPDSNKSLLDAIGLMGTPNNVLTDDWMEQDGNSLQLPTSPDGLLYELAYEYCMMNWCLRSASDSLFSYENEFGFSFYEKCDEAYPGSVTNEEASDELIARCEGDSACVTEGLIGGDEGTSYALAVMAEFEETRGRSNVTSEPTEPTTEGRPTTESPTSQPTTPTPSTPPPTTPNPQAPPSTSAPVAPVGNARCEDAMTLSVDGSTTLVSNSESSHTEVTCSRTSYEGTVSWFTFIGTGRRIKISTCTDETDPTINTYVAVFSSPGGGCGASDWTCVTENDNDVGRCAEKPNASTLFLNTVASQTYYIVVIGNNNAIGNFGLLLTDESNGCSSAQNILIDGMVTTGSNANGAAVGGLCDRSDTYTPEDYHGLGVWYSFTGSGRRIKISTCTDETDAGFDTYVAVYSSPGGNCDSSDWTCVTENVDDASRCSSKPESSTLFMNSVAGQTYYIVVIGNNNAIGTFGLLLTDESNGCDGAQNILVDGAVTTGSNANGAAVGGLCDRSDTYTPEDYHGLGVWYSFAGTGRRIKISTCTDETDAGFDTYMAVYSSPGGNCDSSDWTCVTENVDDASRCSSKPESSTLFMNSVAGQTYYIVVIGNNNAIGTFGLLLTDESNGCDGAQNILVDGAVTTGSNANGAAVGGLCDRSDTYTPEDYHGLGVWYSFAGTGRRIKISTCTDETDAGFDTYMAVYSAPGGNCDSSDWTCVTENVDDASRCSSKPESSTLFMNSVAGQTYYIVVIGNNNAIGTFGLLLTDESNGCSSAQNILVDGMVTTGSNANGAAVGGLCDRSDTYTPEDYHGLGVWYSFTGSGRRIKISTCTDETDAGFDTYIAVYASTDSTSCDAADWDCISENESDASQCSTKPKSSILFFDSVSGQKYYIVVIGNNNAIGTFGLVLEDEGSALL